jgi:putative oxidoreductase
MTNDYILLLSRVILGFYFLFNSFNHFRSLNSMAEWVKSKNIPVPKLMVALTGILLLIGGFSILLGAYIEIGITALTLFFLPVTFVMHDFWRETDPQMKMMHMINFMKNLALWAAILALLFIPQPWPFSLNLGLF